MKRVTLIAMSLFFVSGLLANQANTFGKKLNNSNDATEVGISFFQGTWAEALIKAKEDKKIIFLDAYASWCGPCKMMSAKTFTNEEVGKFFNKNFINFKMDMEKNADGPRLSSKYSLRAYPTLYFVNSDENIVHSTLGYQEPKDLIANGEVALTMVD